MNIFLTESVACGLCRAADGAAGAAAGGLQRGGHPGRALHGRRPCAARFLHPPAGGALSNCAQACSATAPIAFLHKDVTCTCSKVARGCKMHYIKHVIYNLRQRLVARLVAMLGVRLGFLLLHLQR